MPRDAEGWYTVIECYIDAGSQHYKYKTRDPSVKTGDVVCVMVRDTPKILRVADVYANEVHTSYPLKWTLTIKG